MQPWFIFYVLLFCVLFVSGQSDFGVSNPRQCCSNNSKFETECVCGVEITFLRMTKFKKFLINDIKFFFKSVPSLSNHADTIIIEFIKSVNETTTATLAINGSSSFAEWFRDNINNGTWLNNSLIMNATARSDIIHISKCPSTEKWYLATLVDDDCILPPEILNRGPRVSNSVITASGLISFLCAMMVYAIVFWKYQQKKKELLEEKKTIAQNRERSDTELAYIVHPYNTPFKQHSLDIWSPKLTTGWAMVVLLVISMIMLPLGVIFLMSSTNVVYVEKRYDNLPQCTLDNWNGTDRVCNITIDIPKEMNPPIFFYYKLGSFFQNYRRYVKSRSSLQLKGRPYDEYIEEALDKCEPAATFTQQDLQNSQEILGQNSSGLVGKVLYPCGLVAQSMFTDTFFSPCLQGPDQNVCDLLEGADWNGTGIAWESDLRKVRFIEKDLVEKETNISIHGRMMPKVTNEDFVVWMRTATLPMFTKLNRKIGMASIPAGSVLELTISNSFPSHQWDGTKSVVLSTTSWIGGQNRFFGIAYLSVGMTCFFLTVFVYFKSDV